MVKYEYKNTGIDWLFKFPKHWRVDRIKDHFRDDLKQINEKDLSKIEEVAHYSIPSFDETGEPEICTGDSISSGKKVLKGIGLLYSKLNCWKPRVWFYAINKEDILSVASTEFIGLRPIHDNQNDLTYIQYLLSSEAFTSTVKIFLKSVTNSHQRISPETFVSQNIPFPPLPEQKAIANYLDKACKRIDNIIDIKQKQLDSLEQNQHSVLFDVLTRGLNKETEFITPGIAWMAKMPKHWKKKRVKDVVSLRSGDSITSTDINDFDKFPVYGGNGFRGYSNSYTHDGEFALIGRQGALCGNINYAKGKFWASEHAVVATPVHKCSILWIGELLRIMNLNQYSNAAAQPGLAVERIKQLYLPVPPYNEQIEIESYIDDFTTKNKKIKENIDSQITTLQSYRKSLIHECVTGKKQVWEGEIETVH